MYCEKCGQEMPDNAVFCGKCGARVSNALPKEATAEHTTKLSDKQQELRKNNKNMTKVIILSLIGIFLVLAIIMVCRLSIHPNGEQDTPLEEAKIGDVVIFGVYEQDNNWFNGKEPIEWIVLDKEDGRVLLLSQYVLDCKPYHKDNVDITWEGCSLRGWLNSEFYKTAFNKKQQKQIMETLIVNSDNPQGDTPTPGGNSTYDKIFLLSLDEIGKYTGTDTERIAHPTLYAHEEGCSYWNDSESASWWLRSPGSDADSAAYVYYHGGVYEGGNCVTYGSVGVRPALWVSYEY